MAESGILHKFVSAKADSPDPTLVSASEWNEAHVMSGGLNGQRLVFDNTQPNNFRWVDGLREYNAAQVFSVSTATPLNNLAVINFTLTTPAVVLYSYSNSAFASVGNAQGLLRYYVDNVEQGQDTILSPNGNFSRTVTRTLNAGAHSFHLGLTTSGNVNITSINLYTSVMTIGV